MVVIERDKKILHYYVVFMGTADECDRAQHIACIDGILPLTRDLKRLCGKLAQVFVVKLVRTLVDFKEAVSRE